MMTAAYNCRMWLLDKYYVLCNQVDVVEMITRRKINIDWIIEAGCHDGSDSLVLLNNFPSAELYAFEPDPFARDKASQKYSESGRKNIHLSAFGLSDHNTSRFMRFIDGVGGSGSSEVDSHGDVPVELVVLDDIFRPQAKTQGLLWLDVEGHATSALRGMEETLKQVSVAKIEVQMHDMTSTRPRDFVLVLSLLKKAGLNAVSTPIHPGYFGDIVFIHSRHQNLLERVSSFLLTLQMRILHEFIYPMIRKPAAFLKK